MDAAGHVRIPLPSQTFILLTAEGIGCWGLTAGFPPKTAMIEGPKLHLSQNGLMQGFKAQCSHLGLGQF